MTSMFRSRKYLILFFSAAIFIFGVRPIPVSSGSLVVAASTFTVAFEKDTYLFVEPFVRESSIWGTVRNTGSTDDSIMFSFVESDGRESPAGFVFLKSGESSVHEFGKITREMKDENNERKLKIRMASKTNPSSQAEIELTILFPPNTLDNAFQPTITINVYDKKTNQPINDALVYYYLGSESRTEKVRAMGNGQYQVTVPDSDAVAAVASRNGLDWDGYTVEVQTPGYKSYVEGQLKPSGSSPIIKDIFLEPLGETVNFEPAWLKTLEYPGVWRVRPSKDWEYIAVAMGKHPDPWDPKALVPTNVYLFKSSGELVWKYAVEDAVWGLDISPDGSLVAAGTHSGSLQVIQKNGTVVWTKRARSPSNLRELRFSNTGAYLAGETSIRAIELYDSRTGDVIYQYNPGVEVFWRGVTFSNDDRYAAFAGNGSLILIDLQDKKPLWQKYVAGVPYDVRIPSDLSAVVVADKGDSLWYYNFDGTLRWYKRDLTVLTDMDMTDDGRRVLTLSHDGTVRMFDAEGNLVWRRAIGFGGHNGLDMSADGGYIAVGSGGKDFPYSVYLLDGDGNQLWKHSQPGPVPEPFHPYMMSAMSVAISDDASRIVAGYGTGYPGIQMFVGTSEEEVEDEREREKTTTSESVSKDWSGKYKIILWIAGILGVILLAIIIFRKFIRPK